jgi:hypothetical protein
MILPTKHTKLEQSFLGFGGYILKIIGIGEGLSIDEIWRRYQKDFSDGIYTVKQSFDNLLLTLAFLYSINTISEIDGEVKKCS